MDIPLIISVDDHVVEPPDLWTDRIPAKFKDRAPRVERDSAVFHFEGGVFSYEKGVEGGEPCDWWLYDDLVYPFPKLSAAVGFSELDVTPTTFDEIRPGCWIKSERIADMDANHTEASICFPNTLPRFCGQTFLERDDKELALLCVQAYNDWMVEDWCAGEGKGRLIPLTMVPLWDVELAAAEVRRAADMGSFAVTFPENPYPLGLPSIHDKDRYWEPFFQACQDTETTICMHIGSSSKMPTTSPDAPFIVSSTLTFSNAMGSMCDYIFSGTLERFPTLKIAYSEGQVGWMPYVMERADKLAAERAANSFGTSLPHLRLHLRRRDRSRQPRRHRHGPDLLRDRLPARRLHLPALGEGGRGHLHPGRPRRRRALQAPPRERDHRVRPGAVRHHQLADTAPMTDDTLLVDDRDGLRTITINRPEVKNALTAAMRSRFCELIEEADRDDTTRAIIVTAVDPVFSGGVDFKEVAAGTAIVAASNPGVALRAATTPVVCAVNGACVTGALEIALSCTFIVASERARFADTHARLDVVAAWGLTALLPRAVGVRKAAELSITGNFVDAAEALRLGLVNHVVPHDELLPFTRALAHDIAPTGAVAEVLDLYRRGDGLPLAEALAMEAAHAAGRRVDPADFGAAGSAAAARGKR
jgi:enoyl-CoA hydratase/carnithine racemase